MIFLDNKDELDFVLHEHIIGNEEEYQLSIMTGDSEMQYLRFPKTGKADMINDNPNITRLFGSLEDDMRSSSWLTYEGITAKPETIEVNGESVSAHGVYKILTSGKVKMGKQSDVHTELLFNSKNLTDRWILRKMDNIFDRSLLSEDKIYLLWKPPLQRSFNSSEYHTIECKCPNETLSSMRSNNSVFEEIIQDEGIETLSKLTTDVIFDIKTQSFEGISAAEGTWIDMFGERYIYTPEFIIHNFNEQRAKLASGEKITINTEHPDFDSFEGEITDVQLVQEPIYHIRVKGIYTGPADLSEDRFGLSYEFKLRSVWNAEFEGWVPFQSITDKISIVKKPACKICWIKKVK